jgi:hypothetical protein
MVGFANSIGGTLIIGIREDGGKPSRAAETTPVQACADLADRIAKVADRKIEPRLPGLAAVPVLEDGGGGEGYVVLSIPQSRLAPHRLRYDNECYLRRDDRTEKLTMHEIHDLTLQRYQADEEIESRYAACREEFEVEVEDLAESDLSAGGAVIGTRVTAVPQTTDLHIERPGALEGGVVSYSAWEARLGDSPINRRLHPPVATLSERALLRGRRYSFHNDKHDLNFDIFRNGTVNYSLMTLVPSRPDGGASQASRDRIYLTWVLGAALSVVATADRLRRAASSPDVPYGVELQLLRSPLRQINIAGGTDVFGRDLAVRGNLRLPRLPLGSLREGRSRIVSTVSQDLYNSSGRDFQETVEVLPPED